MKINTLKGFFVDSMKSLKRNMTISIASSLTVAATLFIFGVFLLLAFNVNKQVEIVQSKVEVVVFLKEDITYGNQKNLEKKLNEISGVNDVIYETRAQALEKFKEQLGDNKELLEGYTPEKSPMPNSFIVKIDKPEIANEVEKAVKSMPGVEQVGNEKDLIATIGNFVNTINWVGVVVFAILGGVSIFLISNTIKLAVFSRRREIGIMKFVGATDWFIRWPFIIEGVILGIIGALVSNGLLYVSYSALYKNVATSLITSQLISPSYVYTSMLAVFLLGGIIVGALGSFLSLRKFLDV